MNGDKHKDKKQQKKMQHLAGKGEGVAQSNITYD